MANDRTCPQCGGPLMAGPHADLCARCLLDTALRNPAESGSAAVPEPGDFIGNCRVVRLLGEGGMGMVYLAEQDGPISRFVAVKIIKLGMDTRAVLARFLSEQQALALMDHPNIAQVHEAGSSASGRPYFVMEYVPGVPITTYCDSHFLGTRQRLELFLLVIGAVQHAHQKGVIHRDLKPSNILVMERDGEAVPKIIDFGLAKATAKTCSEGTLFTEAGVLVGTPEYLSPEQASANPADIDTRTDIYSLGVLLYELLVGTRPIELHYLRKKGYDEIRRIICEEDLPTPTSRLLSLGQRAREIASHRATDASGLQRQVRGDLEWITMTAVAKERNRRYASASELAADILRHLHDEPVMAGPPTTSYRLRKFVRKNRGLVLTLAAVVASLLLGLTTSTVLYFRAERHRIEAEREKAAAERGHLEARRQTERANTQKFLAEQASVIAEQERKEAEVQHIEAEHQRLIAERQTDQARRQGEQALAERMSAEKQRAVAEKETRVAVEQSQAAEEQRAAAERQRLVARRQSYIANLNAADLHIRSSEISEARRRLDLCPPELRGWEWRYLLWKSDSSVASLPGLTTPTEASALVGFGPDGANLFRASAEAFEWWPIGAAKTTLNRLSLSPPLAVDQYGTHVLSASGRIIDTATGKLVAALAGQSFDPTCAAIDSNGRVACGNKNGTIEIWDIRSERPRARLDAHIGDVLTVAFSADGQRIVSGGEDRMLRVWDAVAAHPMYGISGHGAAVLSAVWSTDRRVIVSGSADKTARIWDAITGKPVHTLSGHDCSVQGIAINPEGTTIATASCQTIRLWETHSGNLMATLSALWHSSITSLAFNSDGGRVMAAGAHGEIKVWDARTYGGGILARAEADTDRAAVSPTGRRIARHNPKTQILEMWDVRDRKPLWTVPESGRVNALTFSPDSQRIVAGLADGSVRVWNAATGQQVGGPGQLHAAVLWLAFTPDGTRLLFCLPNHPVLWDSSHPGLLSPWSIPSGPAAFSPDGKRLAVGQSSGETSIWEVRSSKLLAVLKGHSGPVESVAFNPDGSRIVTGSRDQTICVWDADAYDGLLVLGNHEETPTSLVFSPDGIRMYSVSAEGTVRVWDTRPGTGSA